MSPIPVMYMLQVCTICKQPAWLQPFCQDRTSKAKSYRRHSRVSFTLLVLQRIYGSNPVPTA